MKTNCWDFKNCGREQGGINNGASGTCPAATDERLDGVHGGKNAGRACWALSSTLCESEARTDFIKRFKDCHACDFFKTVVKEEGAGFIFTVKLHERLKNSPPQKQPA